MTKTYKIEVLTQQGQIKEIPIEAKTLREAEDIVNEFFPYPDKVKSTSWTIENPKSRKLERHLK